jgi:hypothetical protein
MLPDRAWNHTQPIGIDDVLHHLTACLSLPPEVNAVFDVGGPDVLTFGELVAGCAVAAGLPRPVLVPLPVSAPRLTARALERRAARRSAPRGAAAGVDGVRAGVPGGAARRPASRRTHVLRGGGAPGTRRDAADRRRARQDVAAPAAVLWDVITGLGGDTGWYTVPGAWALRGGLDRLLGGVGARRTRPERIEPARRGTGGGSRRSSRAPGCCCAPRPACPAPPGWSCAPSRTARDRSRYVQRVLFTPNGLAGRAYWYAQRPAHDLVFGVMARTVAGVAAHRARTDRQRPWGASS